mgnify:FL=1
MFIDTFWTFMETKQWMWWVVHYSSDNSVLHPLLQIFYNGSMQALVHHWQKYIANGGDYAEKNNNNNNKKPTVFYS